jgi:hypothetical protein
MMNAAMPEHASYAMQTLLFFVSCIPAAGALMLVAAATLETRLRRRPRAAAVL